MIAPQYSLGCVSPRWDTAPRTENLWNIVSRCRSGNNRNECEPFHRTDYSAVIKAQLFIPVKRWQYVADLSPPLFHFYSFPSEAINRPQRNSALTPRNLITTRRISLSFSRSNKF